MPVLTAYTENGSVLWRARLDDFKPLAMVEMQDEHGRDGIRNKAPEPGESFLHTLFSDVTDHFYLGYFTQGAEKGSFKNHVFRVDARTGEGEYLGNGEVSAVSGSHAFLGLEYPYPRVTIYKRKSAIR